MVIDFPHHDYSFNWGRSLTQTQFSILTLKLVAIIRSLSKTVKVLFPWLPLPVYRYETFFQTRLAQTPAWSRIGVTILYLPRLFALDTEICGHPSHPFTDPFKLLLAKYMPKTAPVYSGAVLSFLNGHGAVCTVEESPRFYWNSFVLYCWIGGIHKGNRIGSISGVAQTQTEFSYEVCSNLCQGVVIYGISFSQVNSCVPNSDPSVPENSGWLFLPILYAPI